MNRREMARQKVALDTENIEYFSKLAELSALGRAAVRVAQVICSRE